MASALTRLLEDLGADANLLGELVAIVEPLHETTPDIVLAVPLDLLARRAVEHESDGELRGVSNGTKTWILLPSMSNHSR
jgi:hypothetical protein